MSNALQTLFDDARDSGTDHAGQSRIFVASVRDWPALQDEIARAWFMDRLRSPTNSTSKDLSDPIIRATSNPSSSALKGSPPQIFSPENQSDPTYPPPSATAADGGSVSASRTTDEDQRLNSAEKSLSSLGAERGPTRTVPPKDIPAASSPPAPPRTYKRDHVVHANTPRVPLSAITAAGTALAQSLLDTWTIGTRRFGDMTPNEVEQSCVARDRQSKMMRAMIKGLPGNAPIRQVLTPQDAETRRKTILQALDSPGTEIELTQPHGYRHAD